MNVSDEREQSLKRRGPPSLNPCFSGSSVLEMCIHRQAHNVFIKKDIIILFILLQLKWIMKNYRSYQWSSGEHRLQLSFNNIIPMCFTLLHSVDDAII